VLLQKISFLVFFFFTFICLNAQTFNAGVLGGINFSQIDGDFTNGYNLRGLNVGGHLEVNLTNEKWSTSLELLYSSEGSTDSRVVGEVLKEARLKLIQIPVYLNYYPVANWKFSFGGMYGRIFNFNLEDLDGRDIAEQVDFESNLFYVTGGFTWFITDHIGLGVHLAKSTSFQKDSEFKDLYSRPLRVTVIYRFDKRISEVKRKLQDLLLRELLSRLVHKKQSIMQLSS